MPTETSQDEKRGLERLSDALRTKGILFNSLAKELGVETGLVSRYLSGRSPIPADHLDRICVGVLGLERENELYVALFRELGQNPPSATAAAVTVAAPATAPAPVAAHAAAPAPAPAAEKAPPKPVVATPVARVEPARVSETTPPKASMESLSAQFDSFLQKAGFNVVGRSQSGDQPLFFLPFAAGRTLRVQVDETRQKLTAVVPLPFRLPEERGEERMRVLELLAAFNWRFSPQASSDLSDGEICIEYGLETRAPVALPREFFHGLIATALAGYHQLNQAIINVLYRGKEAGDAMDTAQTEIEKPIERAKV